MQIKRSGKNILISKDGVTLTLTMQECSKIMDVIPELQDKIIQDFTAREFEEYYGIRRTGKDGKYLP